MYTLVLEPKNILRSEEVQKSTIDALHKYMKLDEDKLLKFIKDIKILTILYIEKNFLIVRSQI